MAGASAEVKQGHTITLGEAKLCSSCVAEIGGAQYLQCVDGFAPESEGEMTDYINAGSGKEGIRGGKERVRAGREGVGVRQERNPKGDVVAPETHDKLSLPDHFYHTLTPPCCDVFPLKESTSVPYLPIVWASTDYLPLLKGGGGGGQAQPLGLDASTRGDTQSLCGECMCAEVGSEHQVYQPKSLGGEGVEASSQDSLCSQCKEEEMASTPDRHYYNKNWHFTLDLQLPRELPEKAKVEQKPSNDSGVMTASPDTVASFSMGVWSQKSSVSEPLSDLEESLGESSDETFSCETLGEEKGCGPLSMGRLVGAPRSSRFKGLFEELEITETDIHNLQSVGMTHGSIA